MNKLQGKIIRIDSSDGVSIVETDVKGDVFSSVVLETPETASYLRIGGSITLLFKETEVSIGKNLSGLISLRNRIQSRIKAVEKSKVLTKITFDYRGTDVAAIISTNSADRLALKVSEEAEWLVKATEVSLLSEESL